MQKSLKLFQICLFIHDGAAAPGGDGASAGQSLGGNTDPGLASQGKKGASTAPKVVYGKQPDSTGEAAPPAQEQKANEQTPEDRKKAFREMIEGEYKGEFSEFFQEKFDRRFKDHKGVQDRLTAISPVIDLLSDRYGVKDADPAKILAAIENDNMLWEEAAEQAGMDVDQYKNQRRLEREVSQLRQAKEQQDILQMGQQKRAEWEAQSETLKETYPGFDLQAELQNDSFFNLLKAGASVESAYHAIHFNEIVTGVVSLAGKRAEQNVVNNIQTKGQRPAEAGASSMPGVIVKNDVSKLTRADRAEIARRVARGEKVSF